MAESFFSKLFSLFASPASPKAKLKSQMKHLAKDISSNRFSKFYKPKTKEVTADFGKFIYAIYKIAYPIQIYLHNAAKSNILRQVVVESYLDDETGSLIELLDGSQEAWEKIGDIHEIEKTINEKLEIFTNIFNADLIKEINHCYSSNLAMIRFITFDFYTMVKKFDISIREKDFSYTPKFANAAGSGLVNKIKDFLDVISEVITFNDWEHLIKILQGYRSDKISIGNVQWNKIVNNLFLIYKSGILELMIRHIDENPSWRFKPVTSNESIAKEYVESKQKEIKDKLDKVVSSKRNTQKSSLLFSLFGRMEITKAQYYSIGKNEFYKKRSLAGFIHAEAFNYFFAFMGDVFGVEIKDLCDRLTIHGIWFNREQGMKMSEDYHRVLEIIEKTRAFDNDVADTGNLGSKLKATAASSSKNSSQARITNSIFKSVNDEALELINNGIQLLMVTSDDLKSLLNDIQSASPKLISNWQDIDNNESPIVERIKSSVEKIDVFAKLMDLFR